MIKLYLPYLLPGIIMFIIIMSVDIVLIIWGYDDSTNSMEVITSEPSTEEVSFDFYFYSVFMMMMMVMMEYIL